MGAMCNQCGCLRPIDDGLMSLCCASTCASVWLTCPLLPWATIFVVCGNEYCCRRQRRTCVRLTRIFNPRRLSLPDSTFGCQVNKEPWPGGSFGLSLSNCYIWVFVQVRGWLLLVATVSVGTEGGEFTPYT